MPAFPYYPRYPQRFALSTATWTDEEVGAYCRLLDYQWDHGSIPLDPKRRNRIADSLERSWPVLEDKFESDGNGGLVNPFLEKIRQDTKAKSKQARQAAMASWGPESKRNAGA